jgi:NitT/TauT family transport system substrate-binding protein
MRHAPAGTGLARGTRPLSRKGPAAAVACAGVVLAGCSALGGSSTPPDSAPGSPAITVAAIPDVGNAPLYLAAQNGYFKQHGLTVRIKNYSNPGAEVAALGNGQADIAAGDYTDFLARAYQAPFVVKAKGTSNGTALRVVADGYDAAPNVMQVLTMPNSPITSPQALQGKTIATPPAVIPAGPAQLKRQPYNIETLATQSVLRNDGVSVTSINWQPSSPVDEIQALRNGQVGAILVSEPYLFQAESELGARSVLDSASGVTSGLPLLGYFTTSTYAAAHPASVRAFRAALAQAQAAAAQRAPVQSLLTSKIGIKANFAPLINLGTYPTSVTALQLQRVADLMTGSGMLTTSLDASKLLISS